MRMVTRASMSDLGRSFIIRAVHLSDLEKLGMWELLQGLLATPSDDIKVQALWVIGTAMQNNPTAQRAVRFTFLQLSFLARVEALTLPAATQPNALLR